MSMTWQYKYASYASGDDTTGNGSLLTPYKTLAKACDIVKALGGGYAVGLLDNQTIAAKYDLASTFVGTSAAPIGIHGVNASGAYDGTQRNIDGGGVCDFAFKLGNGTVRYCDTAGIHFTNLTQYAFEPYGGTAYDTFGSLTNIKISNCKGLTSTRYAFSGTRMTDISFLNCTATGGILIGLRLNYVDRMSVIGCSMSNFADISSNIIIRNFLMHDCTISNGNPWTITLAPFILHNFIIDGVTVTGGAVTQYILPKGDLRNGIISNCSATGSSIGAGVYISDTTTDQLLNIGFYNNTFSFGRVQVAANKYNWDLGNGIYTISTDPYINRAADDFSLTESFAMRRRALTLGAFNDVHSIINATVV